MADPKLEALKRLAGRQTRKELRDDEAPQEEGTFSKMIDYLGRPGAATREAISAAQQDKPIMEAAYKGLTSPSEEAPTGADITDVASEKYGLTNPYIQGTLATLADIADPTMFIPGGGIGKGAKALGMVKRGAKPIAKTIPEMKQAAQPVLSLGGLKMQATPDSVRKLREALARKEMIPGSTPIVDETAGIVSKAMPEESIRKLTQKEDATEKMFYDLLNKFKKTGE